MKYLTALNFVYLYSILIGCNGSSATPTRYKYLDTISTEVYKKNAIEISDSVGNRIRFKIDPYYPKEYDSLTEILVDTILFSPQNDRIAFFVITKNSNDKLLDKGGRNEFHYNVHCFVGILAGSNIRKIGWVSAFSIFNYNDRNSASHDIRYYYFVDLTNRKNMKNESTFKYNFDDVRFWNGPLWNRYF